MTPRERFNAMLDFRKPDRPFIWMFGDIRPGTLSEWIKQGHPEDTLTSDLLEYDRMDFVPVNVAHYPQFEESVVESRDGHVTYYDNEGALRIDPLDAQGSGFVTRKWLSFPVTDQRSFHEMKERYVPGDVGRRGDGFDELAVRSRTNRYPVYANPYGFYWTMRQWMGFEGLSVTFHDQPSLIVEMLDFVLEFNIELIRKHFSLVDIDIMTFSEDMAYKTACMVSPVFVREQLVPRYRELVQEARRAGVKRVFIDSDGHVSELIPAWIEAGISGTAPVEIAAEQDILSYAEKYGGFGFIGGIDKRVLSRSPEEVRAEIERKAPVLYRRGGWIPCMDHAVPADARFDNFRLMIQLLKDLWPYK